MVQEDLYQQLKQSFKKLKLLVAKPSLMVRTFVQKMMLRTWLKKPWKNGAE